MPYEIRDDHPDCSGFAVVKQGTSEVMGCHPTRRRASRQMAALYAQEADMPDRDEEQVIRREFPAVLEPAGDGRTLDLRIVPYNTVARVSDDGGPAYEEMWVPGAFDKQLNAANRVLVNVEHEKGFSGVVGRGAEFREAEEGFEGSFRILAGPDGDKALELVNEGVLTGVSLEAVPLRSERTAEGVVKRVKARLVNIALCRFPAFKEAQVLAVRETPTVNFTYNTLTGSTATTSSSFVVGEKGPELFIPAQEAKEPEPEPEKSYRISIDGVDNDVTELELLQAMHDGLLAKKAREKLPESEVDEILQRIGYEPLLKRAVVRRPWDGSASRFEDEQWQRSCILDRGDQFDTPKTRYALPVLEPNGDLNVNAMHAAAAVLAGGRGGVSASSQAKAAAARKLRRYYGMAGEEMPPAAMAMAGRS